MCNDISMIKSGKNEQGEKKTRGNEKYDKTKLGKNHETNSNFELQKLLSSNSKLKTVSSKLLTQISSCKICLLFSVVCGCLFEGASCGSISDQVFFACSQWVFFFVMVMFFSQIADAVK